MHIASMFSQVQVGRLPKAPVPPPGGNIENRQPPAAPSAPPQKGGSESPVANELWNMLTDIETTTDTESVADQTLVDFVEKMKDSGTFRPGLLINENA